METDNFSASKASSACYIPTVASLVDHADANISKKFMLLLFLSFSEQKDVLLTNGYTQLILEIQKKMSQRLIPYVVCSKRFCTAGLNKSQSLPSQPSSYCDYSSFSSLTYPLGRSMMRTKQPRLRAESAVRQMGKEQSRWVHGLNVLSHYILSGDTSPCLTPTAAKLEVSGGRLEGMCPYSIPLTTEISITAATLTSSPEGPAESSPLKASSKQQLLTSIAAVIALESSDSKITMQEGFRENKSDYQSQPEIISVPSAAHTKQSQGRPLPVAPTGSPQLSHPTTLNEFYNRRYPNETGRNTLHTKKDKHRGIANSFRFGQHIFSSVALACVAYQILSRTKIPTNIFPSDSVGGDAANTPNNSTTESSCGLNAQLPERPECNLIHAIINHTIDFHGAGYKHSDTKSVNHTATGSTGEPSFMYTLLGRGGRWQAAVQLLQHASEINSSAHSALQRSVKSAKRQKNDSMTTFGAQQRQGALVSDRWAEALYTLTLCDSLSLKVDLAIYTGVIKAISLILYRNSKSESINEESDAVNDELTETVNQQKFLEILTEEQASRSVIDRLLQRCLLEHSSSLGSAPDISNNLPCRSGELCTGREQVRERDLLTMALNSALLSSSSSCTTAVRMNHKTLPDLNFNFDFDEYNRDCLIQSYKWLGLLKRYHLLIDTKVHDVFIDLLLHYFHDKDYDPALRLQAEAAVYSTPHMGKAQRITYNSAWEEALDLVGFVASTGSIYADDATDTTVPDSLTADSALTAPEPNPAQGPDQMMPRNLLTPNSQSVIMCALNVHSVNWETCVALYEASLVASKGNETAQDSPSSSAVPTHVCFKACLDSCFQQGAIQAAQQLMYKRMSSL